MQFVQSSHELVRGLDLTGINKPINGPGREGGLGGCRPSRSSGGERASSTGAPVRSALICKARRTCGAREASLRIHRTLYSPLAIAARAQGKAGAGAQWPTP